MIKNGGALMISATEVAAAECSSPFRHTTLRLQRSRVAQLVRHPEDTFMRPMAGDESALRLLTGYLAIMREPLRSASPDVERAVADHLYDLVALLVGPDRDTRELIDRRGLRAARIEAARRFVMANVSRPDLAVHHAASGQGVSARYIQMLFEAEGTTFSAFVL